MLYESLFRNWSQHLAVMVDDRSLSQLLHWFQWDTMKSAVCLWMRTKWAINVEMSS